MRSAQDCWRTGSLGHALGGSELSLLADLGESPQICARLVGLEIISRRCEWGVRTLPAACILA